MLLGEKTKKRAIGCQKKANLPGVPKAKQREILKRAAGETSEGKMERPTKNYWWGFFFSGKRRKKETCSTPWVKRDCEKTHWGAGKTDLKGR